MTIAVGGMLKLSQGHSVSSARLVYNNFGFLVYRTGASKTKLTLADLRELFGV